MASFFDHEVKTLMGETVKLNTYEGNVALVVNVASKCGYTPQYKGLQALYEEYKDKDFVVLAFPSNDFGAQEPGNAEEIKKFCDLNYGVKFPMFEKNPVKGGDKQPVYQFLTTQGKDQGEVAWNFEKFLVDPSGKVVGRFKSGVAPDSKELKSAIDALLR